jgi:ribosome biogenesis GTPase
MIGSSGVGKSSLVNHWFGRARQVVHVIDDNDRGRHTTSRRELFALPGGALVIDTPGMRELGHWIAERPEPADHAFDDIAALAERCRFRNCRHADEPGCAVRDAISPERLASFHKLADERRTGAARQTLTAKLAETRRARARKPPPTDD